MKVLLIALALCAIKGSIYACSHRKTTRKTPIRISLDEGIFTTGPYDRKPACMNIRVNPETEKFSDLRRSQICEELVPGITHLETGTIKDFFYSNVEELKQQYFEKVFYFTCNPNHYSRKFEFDTVPLEILHIEHAKNINVVKRILSVEKIIQGLENDTQLKKTENDILFNLPFMRFHEISTVSAVYLEIIVCVYKVEMRDDVKPNENVQLEYEKLPSHWSSDVNAYFKFIMKFGTHYRNASTFGGRLLLLASHDSFKGKEIDTDNLLTIINQDLSIQTDRESMTIIRTFGGSTSFQNVHSWETSVPEDPVPLQSTYIPLNELLDPTLSNKSVSLSKFISFETDYQKYKRYHYGLKLKRDRNKLAEFVFKLIENQLKYICSSEYLNLVVNGIERYNNTYLDKFYFSCSSKRGELHYEQNILILKKKKLVHVTPHVCFTFQIRISQCIKAELELPKDTKCIQLFQNPYCTGEAINVYKLSEMIQVFQNKKISSVLLCDID